jgi:integrase
MQKPTGNQNKGKKLIVDPITEFEDINKIKSYLIDHPRDYCIFVLGINTNLRAIDLSNLKVHQVRNLKVGDILSLVESKTNKIRKITVNKGVVWSIQRLLSHAELEDNEYLFQNQNNNQRSEINKLTTQSINYLIKKWTDKCGITGKFGSHTLRKTFGYFKRKQGYSIETLMKVFNHSSPQQTLTYLGIQESEIVDLYLDEI